MPSLPSRPIRRRRCEPGQGAGPRWPGPRRAILRAIRCWPHQPPKAARAGRSGLTGKTGEGTFGGRNTGSSEASVSAPHGWIHCFILLPLSSAASAQLALTGPHVPAAWRAGRESRPAASGSTQAHLLAGPNGAGTPEHQRQERWTMERRPLVAVVCAPGDPALRRPPRDPSSSASSRPIVR